MHKPPKSPKVNLKLYLLLYLVKYIRNVIKSYVYTMCTSHRRLYYWWPCCETCVHHKRIVLECVRPPCRPGGGAHVQKWLGIRGGTAVCTCAHISAHVCMHLPVKRIVLDGWRPPCRPGYVRSELAVSCGRI